jgi:hypothetical protein
MRKEIKVKIFFKLKMKSKTYRKVKLKWNKKETRMMIFQYYEIIFLLFFIDFFIK